MANDGIQQNSGHAPFVQDEYDSAETNIRAGHLLELDSSGDVQKVSTEGATGNGIVADLPNLDPDVEKDEDLTGGNSGETLIVQHIPVGGVAEVRLAAGGDLTTAGNANVTEGDVLVETVNGAVANHTDAETGGEPEGAVYRARESVDNSGAAAGESNQVYIEVVRIA